MHVIRGLLPSIDTILRVTMMSLICLFATLFSLIIFQIHDVWVPINGIRFIPDFVKFGHAMLKLGTQSKENTYRQARTHSHTHHCYRISLLFPSETEIC
jgi:hypothetical protein